MAFYLGIHILSRDILTYCYLLLVPDMMQGLAVGRASFESYQGRLVLLVHSYLDETRVAMAQDHNYEIEHAILLYVQVD